MISLQSICCISTQNLFESAFHNTYKTIAISLVLVCLVLVHLGNPQFHLTLLATLLQNMLSMFSISNVIVFKKAQQEITSMMTGNPTTELPFYSANPLVL